MNPPPKGGLGTVLRGGGQCLGSADGGRSDLDIIADCAVHSSAFALLCQQAAKK
jgi:hypothetical protein